MTEKKGPFVSQVTLIATVIFGAVLTGGFFELLGVVTWIVWAVCIGVLFLFECLFGLIEKPFSANIGAVIATAIMVVFFAITYIQNAPRGSSLFPWSDGSGQTLACFAFLPPTIVSFTANTGNIIYKLVYGK
ncbi:MAG: hypothetical protein J1F28_09985 [Oscillospiraceae bacterium]|nr:hypothetical protein [Oscillospiraceae bacterium]